MNYQHIIAVIPARMASTRLPGKPLADIQGLPMIEHVRRRAQLCDIFDDVLVATCDREIFDTVSSFGGSVVMTSESHDRCTDRVAEAVRHRNADIVVNVQGDEPLIEPEHLEAVVRPLKQDSSLQCANLIAKITENESKSPDVVKTVFDKNHNALYFSREPIPSRKKTNKEDVRYFRQLGIIAFRGDFLDDFLCLPPTPLEEIESCDMMRAVEHGVKLRLVEIDFKAFGVDTKQDLSAANEAMASDLLFQNYR